LSGKFDFYLSIAHDKGLCALVKRCNHKNNSNPDDYDYEDGEELPDEEETELEDEESGELDADRGGGEESEDDTP
jgi:putative bacteriocin